MFGLFSQCSLAQETFSIFQEVDASGRPVRKVCKINFAIEYCLKYHYCLCSLVSRIESNYCLISPSSLVGLFDIPPNFVT